MNSIKRRIRSISESVLHDKIDKRRWAYRHSSLIPSTLRLVLLISLFFWFNVLVVSPSSHSYQIAAAKQIMNSTDHNLKSQTSLQLMTFDLPSKQTINENEDPIVNDLIIKLVAEADSYLSQKSPSVMDKTRMPPSGDKHDFLSLAPFHWPDNTKPNGMPYVYRDGEFNPEIYTAHDGIFMHRMIERVKILSVAYYFTGNNVYANKTSEL